MVGCYEQRLMDHPSREIAVLRTIQMWKVSSVNFRGEYVSNRAKCQFCGTLTNNLVALCSCPKNLPKTKF